MDAGHGLIKVGSALVPFENKFPKDTKLYKLMTTKPGEGLNEQEILEKIKAVAGNGEQFDAFFEEYMAKH